MKRKSVAILTVVLLLMLALGFAAVVTECQRSAIARLEDRIDSFKAETILLRFMVLSRSEESVSARFRFYDVDGRELASFERSWNGYELAIDSIVVPVGNRFLAFPSAVFTDAIPAKRGTSLFGYYDDNGFPALYGSKDMDGPTRRSLSALFSSVKGWEQGAELDRRSFGSAVHDIRELKSFDVGAIYDLVARTAGGIEIIKE